MKKSINPTAKPSRKQQLEKELLDTYLCAVGEPLDPTWLDTNLGVQPRYVQNRTRCKVMLS